MTFSAGWLGRASIVLGIVSAALACGAPPALRAQGDAVGPDAPRARDPRARCIGAERECQLPDGRIGWCEAATPAAEGPCDDVCGLGRSYASLDTGCHPPCGAGCVHCIQGLCFDDGDGGARGAAPASSTAPDSGAASVAAATKELAGLPAVSSDGRRAAIALTRADGARGEANLHLVILEVATDRVVEHYVIIDPADPGSAGREKRILTARDHLSRTSWTPLRELDTAPDDGAPKRPVPGTERRATLARDARVVVRYREPLLEVIEAGGRATRRRVHSWSQPAGPRCKGCADCPAPLAEIERAFIDADHETLLVVLSYHGGTDASWEPDETVHAVRLR